MCTPPWPHEKLNARLFIKWNRIRRFVSRNNRKSWRKFTSDASDKIQKLSQFIRKNMYSRLLNNHNWMWFSRAPHSLKTTNHCLNILNRYLGKLTQVKSSLKKNNTSNHRLERENNFFWVGNARRNTRRESLLDSGELLTCTTQEGRRLQFGRALQTN